MKKAIHTKQSQVLRQALVQLRQQAGLTQRQLAQRLRRERSLVGRLELGERRVDVVEFFWICQACGANPAAAASRLMRDFEKVGSEGFNRRGIATSQTAS